MGNLIHVLSSIIFGYLPISVSDIIYVCKWIFTYASVRVSKYLKKDRLGFYDLSVTGQPDRVGFLPHPTEERLESPQSDVHLSKAEDGILFYGVDSKGDLLIISIRRHLSQKAEATVYLRLASGKVYEVVEKAGFQQSSANKNAFTCAGIQAYCLHPMTRWRLFYSGYLKETSGKDSSSSRAPYVNFSFLWRASSDVYDNPSDINLQNVVESVAGEEWTHLIPPTHKLYKVLDFYSQAGVIMGNVFVEGESKSHQLYLFGQRMRFLGDNDTSEIEFSHTLGWVHQNGLYVHFGQASINKIAHKISYGYVIKPTGNLRKLKKLDLSVKKDFDSRNVREIKAFIDADRRYTFCGSVLEPALSSHDKEKAIVINGMRFFVDGQRGSGIHVQGKYVLSLPTKEAEIVSALFLPECIQPMVVAFTDELCEVSEVTGGKGASLGKLTALAKELKTFTVPAGVVVSTASYKRFVNTDILHEIKHLEDVLYGNKEGDPKEASKRVCDQIVSTNLPCPVTENIVKSVHLVFGDNSNSMRFAVRSSSTAEDSQQMSAAGQMETFLGVLGIKEVLLAVKKCWASQFGFTAIQYKRRYGQSLNSPMAVVIQEMVACEVAGVIFTCDPVCGNTSRISIAANFGLGESVVSAAVEPDTIELLRDENNQLKINAITTGLKNQKVVLMDDGVALQDISESERSECCLSSEDILRLAHLAVNIEKCYRSKRDIEWGIKDCAIFVFQSRPVTTGTEETDFEVVHEMDGALRIENDHFSVSNAAEVLPGAMAPLSRDLLFRQFHIAWQGPKESEWQNGVKARYFENAWTTMCYHPMFNMADVFYKSKPKERSSFDTAMTVAFFGRILDFEEIFEVAYERYHEEQKSSWRGAFKLLKNLFFSGKDLRSVQSYYANYKFPVAKDKTSTDLFDNLMERCCDFVKAILVLVLCNQSSSLWNMSILSVLCQDKEDIDVDVYTDFSELITAKGDVESADVPAAIESLAFSIGKAISPEIFKAMKTEEALRWLKETPSAAGKKFSEFLSRHGHRCFKEMDIYLTPWGSDPRPLAQLLQNMTGNISREASEKETKSIFKDIFKLKTPCGLFSRMKLLLLVPLSRKGVREREAAKSLMVRTFDFWRKATWELAKRMVSEGRIPDPKILFFMTFSEVRELLHTRSPNILAKAYHRQRLYPELDKYRFPEIMRGVPKPINRDENNDATDDRFTMKGIPVSKGVAEGYVRVAVTLEEAASLKAGDILIAYGTDIGWTPYFPSLAGVATELGGLISHGAVISREYGLPCVAGVHGATSKFQTGDYALLDGGRGFIQKVPPPGKVT